MNAEAGLPMTTRTTWATRGEPERRKGIEMGVKATLGRATLASNRDFSSAC
jgi:hypothetical protein